MSHALTFMLVQAEAAVAALLAGACCAGASAVCASDLACWRPPVVELRGLGARLQCIRLAWLRRETPVALFLHPPARVWEAGLGLVLEAPLVCHHRYRHRARPRRLRGFSAAPASSPSSCQLCSKYSARRVTSWSQLKLVAGDGCYWKSDVSLTSPFALHNSRYSFTAHTKDER